MKRPEGFDATPPPPAAAQKKRPAPQKKPAPQKMPAPQKSAPQKPAPEKLAPTAHRKPARQKRAAREPSPRKRTQADDSAHQARAAARERRRYERDEVRRFTRRSRHRRAAWITAAAVVVTLVGTVTIAVYSPLLALTEIEVTGTSNVDPEEVLDAVDGQLGTPLALVDADRLTRELAEFTLIRSYVTETVPPHTLIIHVTEREAIGSVPTASGFTVVDPAGVTISRADTRPEGIPTIELADAGVGSDVFGSVVEVLLALPDSVADRVDRVTAATNDDVTLVLAGAGQRVVWGSADDSNLKARVLAALMATQAENARVEYDVSAPLSAVIRPA
ncbi:MAG: FtsQ-type POTRA domain-containing protein [Homoserinimonas sp.]